MILGIEIQSIFGKIFILAWFVIFYFIQRYFQQKDEERKEKTRKEKKGLMRRNDSRLILYFKFNQQTYYEV
jgi:preprotein translocase subunit YajC